MTGLKLDDCRLHAALDPKGNRRGYARLEWSVLVWNEPSIGFYRSIGAESQDEWSIFRLTDAALRRLAED